jgi:hypothetical protein
MSEMNKYEELTYKQMQEMLPDYVFNRVTIIQARTFEHNLDRFPDLIREVESVKKVFGKVEEMEINKRISQRTRNLSIKVKNQLKEKSAGKQRSPLGVGYVLPILGIIVAGLISYIYFLSLDYTPANDQNYTMNTVEMVKPQEILVTLSDDVKTEDDYIDIASEMSITAEDMNIDDLIIDEEEFTDSVDEYIGDLLLAELQEEDYLEVLNSFSLSQDSYIPYDDIDEDDFQLILEDIQNEKFL